MKALEQMLEFAPTLQKSASKTIDLYAIGTTALYTPPLMIYDFPSMGAQLHIHGSMDGNTLYGGGYKKYGEDKIFKPLNGYEASMSDFDLRNSGMNPLMRGRDY
jgi:hypothetical protein